MTDFTYVNTDNITYSDQYIVTSLVLTSHTCRVSVACPASFSNNQHKTKDRIFPYTHSAKADSLSFIIVYTAA